MIDNLYFLDTETGGLDENIHSLLSLGIVFPTGFCYWEISSEQYTVTTQAMNVNHLDLNHLKEHGTKENIIVKELMAILDREIVSNGGRLVLAGHNIQFDIRFLKVFCKNNGIDYNKYFHYRAIDTSSIIRFLYDQGKILESNMSLEKVCMSLGLVTSQTHNALDDAYLAKTLYQKMLTM